MSDRVDPVLASLAAALVKKAARRSPFLRPVTIEHCYEADKEHRASSRQYMHVFHRPGIICAARAATRLQPEFKVGLIVHELGHLGIGARDHSEEDANLMGLQLTRIPVLWRDGWNGQRADARGLWVEWSSLTPSLAKLVRTAR